MKTVAQEKIHRALWPFERKSVAATELETGLVPHRLLTILTAVLAIIFAALMFIGTSELDLFRRALFIPLAILLARLVAVDLTGMVLLNIYTAPLAVAGLILAPLTLAGGYLNALLGGVWCGVLFFVLSSFGYVLSKGKGGLGGGDFKLAVGLGLWLGLTGAIWLPALAMLINLPLAFIFPKRQLPFGPGLILAFLVLLVA